MNPDWVDVFPITVKNGDIIPASYVNLPEGIYLYECECDQKNSMVSSIHLPTWWATFCKCITQQFAPEKNAVPQKERIIFQPSIFSGFCC